MSTQEPSVNEYVDTSGVVYVAVNSKQDRKYQIAGCNGCAFHDESQPYKILPGCAAAPPCDGEDRSDGRNIHWEVKA